MIKLERIEDFALFLFLHVGRVDGSLHPNERDAILEKMAEIFPGDAYINEKLSTMEKEYSAMGYSSSENLLKDSLSSFSTIDSITKNKIHQGLYAVINANGRVSEEETQALRFFKGWLTAS